MLMAPLVMSSCASGMLVLTATTAVSAVRGKGAGRGDGPCAHLHRPGDRPECRHLSSFCRGPARRSEVNASGLRWVFRTKMRVEVGLSGPASMPSIKFPTLAIPRQDRARRCRHAGDLGCRTSRVPDFSKLSRAAQRTPPRFESCLARHFGIRYRRRMPPISRPKRRPSLLEPPQRRLIYIRHCRMHLHAHGHRNSRLSGFSGR